jgi:hypothetical protein
MVESALMPRLVRRDLLDSFGRRPSFGDGPVASWDNSEGAEKSSPSTGRWGLKCGEADLPCMALHAGQAPGAIAGLYRGENLCKRLIRLNRD